MSRTLQFTDTNFESEVLNSTSPVLVDFWAPWCGPCRTVEPTINEIAAQYEGRVKVGKLNVDENSHVPVDFGIHSIPAVLLFRNGVVVETLVGAQSKQSYEAALERTAA